MKFFLLCLFFIMACSSPRDPNTLELPGTLVEAVDTGYRSNENKARDNYRHPIETLTFFGVTPEMTVLEVSPGSGWYMEILAPFLATKGRYIMALPIADKPYFKINEEKIKNWMNKHPNVAKNMETAVFSPPARIAFPPHGSVDVVLTFRNVHNWMMARGETQAFSAFFNVLKPGGILGVVEHRALPSETDPLAKSGYVREQDIIEMAAKAGFRLMATSEINANPKDTKDHPEGVWTLPPTLKLGDKGRDKYLSIGESDRMTLKFMKPHH